MANESGTHYFIEYVLNRRDSVDEGVEEAQRAFGSYIEKEN